ncbi:NUDIX domain-containing protein [Streptomyces sp. NPDC029674]|uniref:NUDIX domain-containing protein n=1 Tax=Streptomyces sp. NPDC029674 TaxID=3365297 RepID=UPI00384C4D7F
MSREQCWARQGGLLHEALRREVQEEAGLLIGDPARTAFLVHVDSEQHPSALAAAFEVEHWSGDLAPQDDDIEQSAFFLLPDALELLGELDSATQREPIVSYLTGAVAPGATWLYRNRGTKETLVARW